MNEHKPAKCYCGSSSWGKEPETARYTCVSCYRPLWVPIETAPKDSWILVYQPNGESSFGWKFTGGRCFTARWAYRNEFWYDKTSNILEIDDLKDKVVTYLTCIPTHWMPLPDLPKLD